MEALWFLFLFLFIEWHTLPLLRVLIIKIVRSMLKSLILIIYWVPFTLVFQMICTMMVLLCLEASFKTISQILISKAHFVMSLPREKERIDLSFCLFITFFDTNIFDKIVNLSILLFKNPSFYYYLYSFFLFKYHYRKLVDLFLKKSSAAFGFL